MALPPGRLNPKTLEPIEGVALTVHTVFFWGGAPLAIEISLQTSELHP